MRQRLQRVRLAVLGAVMLQFAGCFGGDPELFLSTTVSSAVVANVISFLFTLITDPLLAASAA